MNLQEAQQYLRDNIQITPHLLVLAKEYIVKYLRDAVYEQTQALIHGFLRQADAVLRDPVLVHPSVESGAALREAARHVSCHLAACEAIWSLVHTGVLIPANDSTVYQTPRVSWTTVVGGTGHTGSWDFPGWSLVVPAMVVLAPSHQQATTSMFTDGDLYLRELAIPNLHPLVEEALREAVACFRHDLYTPCLVMLAKGIEGGWTELGLALADVLQSRDKKQADKLKRDLENPFYGLVKRITDVRDICKRKDLLGDVWQRSEVDAAQIEEAALWSDLVRDSRNVVHYQPGEPKPITFESVTTLLLGAVRYLRTLYRAYNSAREVAAGTS
jgi:hypothetical protein